MSRNCSRSLSDRETPNLFPASVQAYLPEDHLARFVVEIVDRLDLSRLAAAYAGTSIFVSVTFLTRVCDAPRFHPCMGGTEGVPTHNLFLHGNAVAKSADACDPATAFPGRMKLWDPRTNGANPADAV